MKAIVPLASEHPAFERAGYDQPRPLIETNEMPMVKWATQCIDGLIDEESYVFPILRSHKEEYDLDGRLRELYGEGVHIVVLEEMAQGPAETVLEAREFINSEELIVLFGDQYIETPIEDQVQRTNADGLLPVFESSEARWSYAKTENDRVTSVKEKEVISSQAIPGLHYFRDGTDFITGAQRMMEKDIRTHGVFKVSPVYNELIEMGRDIQTVAAGRVEPLGTPDDVQTFDVEREIESEQ